MLKGNKILYLIAIGLTVFGLSTLYLSSSVILDLFGVREQEGNYVMFIVWANFICSILYLMTGFGLIKHKLWALKTINSSLILLLAAFAGFIVYIEIGSNYEQKTIYAMIFRTTLTFLFVQFTYLKSIQWKKQ